MQSPTLTPSEATAQAKARLDAANLNVKKLLNASLRSGKGPSPEYKAAYKAAKVLWRLWCNALDVEAGRNPAFPADGTLPRLTPNPPTMKRPTYGTLSDPAPPLPTRFARCMAYVGANPLPSLVLAGSIGFSVGFVLATVWLTTH